ncbi:hypothetical protein TRFO_38830 [Tritrichomonas foetus]|uniref:Exostosin GT47 domain-containing protein n=1 Tax=Tritrichomonas foetus TaxID=1144522 RepID=A0A1J4J8F1_9EUKA|nr:hypothetical protein TRFO_38830 [Tritrichomonas foetus]|eukprot:OHS94969.1 hypothetical protein TRFO_38830 [Tritrichomonas foetus]
MEFTLFKNTIKRRKEGDIGLKLMIMFTLVFGLFQSLLFFDQYTNFRDPDVIQIKNAQKLIKSALKCMNESTEIVLDQDYYHSLKEREDHFNRLHYLLNLILPSSAVEVANQSQGETAEDYWYSHYYTADMSTFGPFVPVFIPWRRIALMKGVDYHQLVEWIFYILNKNYLYITVTDLPCGLLNTTNYSKPNLFIVSANGQGHMAFPLTTTDNPPLEIRSQPKYKVIFRDDNKTHPTRQKVIAAYQKHFGTKFIIADPEDFVRLSKKSEFVLCPRGFSRNTYHLTETILMGHIPIIFYNDIKWLPYSEKLDYSKFSFVFNEKEISKSIKVIEKVSRNQIIGMRQNVMKVRNYFTREKAFNELEKFMQQGFKETLLSCSKMMKSR